MPTLAESLIASSSRPLALRMRSDLKASQQRYLGRAYWVVKEPVGLKYFRFQEEEYAILQMLDGNTSLEEIKDRFEEDFAPQKISFQNLQQFVGMLHRSGLVIAEAAEQGKQLKRRGDEKTRKETVAAMSNVLALRWKGIDPEWLLNKIYPFTRWMFLPISKIIWCLMVATALAMVIVNYDVFRSRLPAFHEFFGHENWLLLGVVLAITKVLHEFGHGLSCKHYGGECHEMGFMLLVLTPCLYCNVSDSWMLPNKWQRAFIGFAGMYIELGLAAIATFIWWYTEPEYTINNIALKIMFISSVSTLLFNGNPLLRYDGYYILADVLEVPNLRQKASNVLQRFLVRWCLGIKMPEDPFLPQSNRFLFGMYTVASVFYRWFVVLSILWFLNKVFEPYGLKAIGQLIAMFGLFGLVVMPLVKFGKFLYVPGRMDQVKMPYVYVSVGVMTAVVLFVLFFPLPHRIECPVYLQPRNAQSVYARIPGRLEEVNVHLGQQVEEGEQLGRLSNPRVDQAVIQLEGRLAAIKVQIKSEEKRRINQKQAVSRIDGMYEELTAVKQKLADLKKMQKQLIFRAGKSGTVMSQPIGNGKPKREGMLPTWSGSLFSAANRGAWMLPPELFCKIGDPNDLEAVMVIDQGDVEFVRPGQTVWIKLEAYKDATFKTKIELIAENKLEVAPLSVSQTAGGPLVTVTDRETGKPRPLSSSYPAKAAVDSDGELLWIGMRGYAKIATDPVPLGPRIVRGIKRIFNFEL